MAQCANLQPSLDSASQGFCISNTSNIGKTFYLEVSDTRGNLISKTDVTITA